MKIIKRFQHPNPTTPSFEIITILIREVFGTYFIEEGNWFFPSDDKIIGRTFFSDRKKAKCEVNDKTVDNLILIYELALTNQSTYDPIRISENLVRVLKEQYDIEISYAMFFDDDTADLRSAKIRALRATIREIACCSRNLDLIDPMGIQQATEFICRKLLASIMRHCPGTYTETVIKALSKRTTQFIV